MPQVFTYLHTDGQTSLLPTRVSDGLLAILRFVSQDTTNDLETKADHIRSLIHSTVQHGLQSSDWRQHAEDLEILCGIGQVLLGDIRQLPPDLESSSTMREELVVNRGMGQRIGQAMDEIVKHMDHAITMEDFNEFQDARHETLELIEKMAWKMGKLGVVGYEEVCGIFSLWPEDLESDKEAE